MTGSPACNFSPPAIPVARPRLPSASRILPYLQEIDTNAWYANHGPLWLRFHTRLVQHWGLQTSELALACNATAALTLALQAAAVEPGSECLLPSWTFVATAGAVRQAGLIPHFVDVQPGTWSPDPAAVQALALRRKVGAIVVVAPFGAPMDLASWDAVAEATGVPVLIDAAAGFDTLRRGGPMRLGRCGRRCQPACHQGFWRGRRRRAALPRRRVGGAVSPLDQFRLPRQPRGRAARRQRQDL